MSHDAHLPGYTYRRELEPAALMPAVGVGIAAGLAAFYLARLLLQRTPLLSPEELELRRQALERRSGRRVRALGRDMVGGADDLARSDVRARLAKVEAEADVADDDYDDLGLADRVREARGTR